MFRRAIAAALAAAALASSVSAQDADWPMESAGDMTVFVVHERYRITAEHCQDEVPALKSGFEDVMKSLKGRIRSIGRMLLDSDAFREMQSKPMPSTLVGALASELENVRDEVQEMDAATTCPQTLQDYRELTDAGLQDFLSRTLAGIQSTMRSLESARKQATGAPGDR
jgi:HAMP domain-containing protein